MDNYIVYHLHSMHSNPTTIMDSVTPYELYIQEAIKNNMKAIGFSEHGNLFKWWEKKNAVEKAGLKYIHGIEMYITKDLNEKVRDNKHCCLIAKNKERCFLEIQHHNDTQKQQYFYNQKLYKISQETGIKLIAGTDTHSLNEDYAKGRELMQKRKHIFFENEEG